MAPNASLAVYRNDCGCMIPDKYLLKAFKRCVLIAFAIGVCLYSGYVNYAIQNTTAEMTAIYSKDAYSRMLGKIADYSLQDAIAKNRRRIINVFDSIHRSSSLCAGVEENLYNYEVDKTGKPDFALESSGGKILGIGNSRNYKTPSGFFSNLFWKLFREKSLSPAAAILRPNVSPGNCWAFHGNSGVAVIKLATEIFVTGISLEHIPSEISPTGNISSAPRKFSLHGLDGEEIYNLGTFEYKKHNTPIQCFQIKPMVNRRFGTVQLNITSNWGNDSYTCVYRVRIHGKLM